ncbi:agamous-like MADS-box protein AGL61 [Solanum stenotomum]|uniref:agamous-like MADS-box protein AGL61 n=1 Tax=Solanum stenotomum TaxID=172797 RepID=UPI0020D17963|nr:agamous-like MADS-box protein AGL61 [Solanum stenotomum]
MDKRIRKGRQKIDMKLFESKEARIVTFSKRKKGLLKKATLTRADVGVLLFSPSGKTYSCGSTSIEKIIDKFLELKLDDLQHDHAAVGKSNVFEAFEDLRKEVQALEENEKESPHSKYTVSQTYVGAVHGNQVVVGQR